MRTIIGILMGIASIMLTACMIGKTATFKTPPALLATDAGKELRLQVKREDIRQRPNAARIGTLKKGQRVTVLKRVGNWVEFSSARYKKAYIWGPSLGYVYQNLYSPYFYVDLKKQSFKPIAYFQQFFSQEGERRQETRSAYELFFKNIGLGSHVSNILETVRSPGQRVKHGITLFVNKETGEIYKVRVDYLKSIKGYKKALKKSELPQKKPDTTTTSHLSWQKDTLLKDINHFIVYLERQQWKSKRFSSIWYIMPDKK